tara:strand:- start:104 stop:289 length:186 start_codon:yes stop_codon:yes gene_type:complete
MEFKQNDTGSFKEIVNEIKSVNPLENIENLNYLYSNAHRTRTNIRWFKGSRDRGFKSDIAA